MATQITQSESEGRTFLRIEGELSLEDALLVERLAGDLIDADASTVVIDLADLDLLDSDSAPILRRLSSVPGISIEGLEIFLQSAIDSAERSAR